jgi:hypothetical protein
MGVIAVASCQLLVASKKGGFRTATASASRATGN